MSALTSNHLSSTQGTSRPISPSAFKSLGQQSLQNQPSTRGPSERLMNPQDTYTPSDRRSAYGTEAEEYHHHFGTDKLANQSEADDYHYHFGTDKLA